VEPEPEGAASFVCSLSLISMHLLWNNHFELAEECSLRMEQLGRPLMEHDPWVMAWIEMARAVRTDLQRNAWATLLHYQRAEASFAEAGDRHCTSVARVFQGLCLLRLGAHTEGQALLEALLASGEATPVVVVDARLFLAMAKTERGAHEEALGEATELAAVMSAAQARGGESGLLFLVAKIQLRRGDLEAAERQALTAIEAFSARPRERALALAMLADVRLAQRRPAEALAAVEQAIAAQEAIPPAYHGGAYLPLLHAEALDAMGDHEGACKRIAAARLDLLARADAIGEPALRRSFLENVPENARTLARARQWLAEQGARA
jgi:tetratricopeptide (TPR) repeat protein